MTAVRQGRRRRLLIAAASVVGHLAVVLALLSAQTFPPRVVELAPIAVALVQLQPPEPPKVEAPPVPKKEPAPVKPLPPKRLVARRAPPSPTVAPLMVRAGPSAEGEDELSDAEIASANTAGSGGGGGTCNMTRWLQSALRKDAMVQAAVAEAHRGKAIRVWNGDWIRHGDQEGAGLAAVREAIIWEVAFAPVACRTEPVHGPVLISLNDAPGSARLVVGSGTWRWSDLLGRRRP